MAPRRRMADWFTQKAAADLLGIDRKTLSRWVADGLVPVHRVPGNRFPMIHKRDIVILQRRARDSGKPVTHNLINSHHRRMGIVDRRRVRTSSAQSEGVRS